MRGKESIANSTERKVALNLMKNLLCLAKKKRCTILDDRPKRMTLLGPLARKMSLVFASAGRVDDAIWVSGAVT